MAENMFCKTQKANSADYRNNYDSIFKGLDSPSTIDKCHEPTCVGSRCCPARYGCSECCSHLHLGEDSLINICERFYIC
jgi:hypothetical protein